MASKTAVVTWGSGEDGQLGIGNNEERYSVCAITALSYQKVSSVVGGSRNSLAICEDGKLFTWGWNQRGTLGHPAGSKTENVPSQVKALSNVKIIQVGMSMGSVVKNLLKTRQAKMLEEILSSHKDVYQNFQFAR